MDNKEQKQQKQISIYDTPVTDRRTAKRRRPKMRISVFQIVLRTVISVLLTLLIVFGMVWSLAFTVAHGPSATLRNLLVISAMQASATKWAPYLVLPPDEVKSILDSGAEQQIDIISADEYGKRTVKKTVTGADGKQYEIDVYIGADGTAVVTDEQGGTHIIDEWEGAIDGIQLITFARPNFRAYMLIIRDPSRVKVGTSSDFNSTSPGIRFYELAERDGIVALLNGGEFYDSGGTGDGRHPLGLTYADGGCVWSDAYTWKTFIGFDKNNKLIVTDDMTKTEADKLAIRDAVSFQTSRASENVLIKSNDGGNVTVYRQDGNTGMAQRSAIGQRADGAVILLATDGRTGSSPGATYNDVIDIMVEYGAVNAAMLDGGSSTMLYYRDYFNLYNYDTSKLDDYQKMGLLNQYKAMTNPRRIPTYFVVTKSS